MKTIKYQQDFEDLIHKTELCFCFVHSSWSGKSCIRLSQFKELAIVRPELNFVVIVNESADNFIYDFLEHIAKLDSIEKCSQSWINGNGEFFVISNGRMIWFESSILNKSLKDLMPLLGI